MKITPALALHDIICDRCRDLGIFAETILEGDAYFVISNEGQYSACCQDCFDRLNSEAEEIE